ncbi:hypothetical protein [Bradyrhizobium brasilense]|uniref:hypothetical protein n=1 Tax=Bradyrhizobium brasilense TaxID=1419277 RepID=UPI00115FB89C|nr:hypothetical protein [Bradyrhizobium brasilense]
MRIERSAPQLRNRENRNNFREKSSTGQKVTQALRLAEFFRACAVGTNFDFGHSRRFVAFAVSPFEEWIWDISDRIWEEDPYQRRILSAGEAIKDARGSTVTATDD